MPRLDPAPVTSPDDPRVARLGPDDVAGGDQIAQMLAATPRERLQLLLDMLAFEERAHRATRLPRERWLLLKRIRSEGGAES